jgi:hypothetical protein
MASEKFLKHTIRHINKNKILLELGSNFFNFWQRKHRLPMKQKSLIVSICVFLGVASHAFASVIALQNAQAANANIVYQYTFDGSTTAERLDQKISPNTPDMVQFTTSGYSPASSFVAGFDGSGIAVQTEAGTLSGGSRPTGAALKTNATITLTTSGTIEFIVKAEILNDSGFALSGISGSGTTSSRWYFFQNGTAATDVARMTYGNNTPYTLIGGTTGVAYNADDWYYVAQTWSITGGTVTLNAWVANLSDATPALTQTISGATATHQGGLTTLLRVGSLTDTANFFRGEVDAVAIYDTALSASTIQSNFNAIPEPTVFGLLGITISGMALALHRRR